MSIFDDEPRLANSSFRQAFTNTALRQPAATPAEGCGQLLGIFLFLLALRPLLFMFIYNVGIDAVIGGHQAINFWAALALSIGYGFLSAMFKRR